MTDGPAAGWYPDPLGRYDHRYWDGTQWTHHASRAGQATVDPLPGQSAPSSAETTATGTEPAAGGAEEASVPTAASDATAGGPTADMAREDATRQLPRLDGDTPTVDDTQPSPQPDRGFAAVGSAPADEPAWPTQTSAPSQGWGAPAAPGSAGGGTPPGGPAQPYAAGGPPGGSWTPPGPSKSTNVKAVISLILALIWVGGLASIVAIILGVMARKDIKRSGGREGGDGVAIAGIVIGALGILATVVGAIAVIGFVNAVESGDLGPAFEDAFNEEFSGEFEEGFGSGPEGELEYTLVDVDFYQDEHKRETGVYADSAEQLEDLGWFTSDDVDIAAFSQGGEYWCVEGRSTTDPSVVWFTDSNDTDGPGPGTC